ncbi:uncharacterized protein LOC132277082 [Cornus florida]|uniref:uncharacterized protein LOC132277082 n=1 Tax=Cornus florida TaxID=4283 RepID=UPI00289E45B3|nr:uncharacterized protein LOC132277082 [Cornus florida]
MEFATEANPTSPSPPLQKSKVRVSSLHIPSLHRFQFTPLIIFLVLILKFSTATSISSPSSQIPYAKYCNHVVPASAPTVKLGDYAQPEIRTAYFAGGGRILGQQNLQSIPNSPKSLSFHTWNIYRTEADRIFKLEASLTLRGPRFFGLLGNSTHRKLRLVHYRPPRIPVRRSEAQFMLSGFWSSASGRICMVGSGLNYLASHNVVLMLNYPNSSTITTALVNGTLQSLDTSDGSNYFEPISILGVSMMNYQYTLIDKEIGNGGFSAYDKVENLNRNFESGRDVCRAIRSASRLNSFELNYISDCDTVNCNPLGSSARILPAYVSFNEIECSDNGRFRYLLDLSNLSYNYVRYFSFNPNLTLVAEGAWDRKKQRLALVACRIFNLTESLVKGSVGDCSIRLTLSLPATLSLRNRSTIVGQIWSNGSTNDSGYFGKLVFHSSANGNLKREGLKYDYTETDSVRRSCMNKMTGKGKRGTYPDGYSSDMRFDMTVKNTKGQRAFGYSSPLSVGDEFYRPFARFSSLSESAVLVNNSHGTVLNISYVMSFTPPYDFKLGGDVSSTKPVDISAEGIYDVKTGVLCMIGCRHVRLLNKTLRQENSLDCEILVNLQYSPLNANDGSHVKGTIESTRSKADPLYFERLELLSNSIYTRQASESIWRMDLEITMVLVSNTLACILVGLQLFHVKKHPNILPFISVVMLIVLTLAHMVPLLLNFEALFLANRNRQNVFIDSGGWLEVNEVLVRVITMIAFLLQFRLLQLTWSARVGDESHKKLWVSDKKVLYLSLPLYIAGGLIAFFVHQWKYSHKTYQQRFFWGDLKSYAGLVLDGYLLPQIVFNLFCDSKEMALAAPFYIGTTIVRFLPHAYDLYRAHSSTWNLYNIYANPRMDYYSTAWDVIICCGGLLCAVLVYFQQRFGGRCFLPKRYRESYAYEKVPVATGE